MYTKDLAHLLRAFRISEQKGTVIIEPVQQLNELPCFARLSLIKGNVHDCQIMSKRGGELMLRDDRALNWLHSVGRLFWRWEEDTPSHTAKSASRQLSTSQEPTVAPQKVERPVYTHSSPPSRAGLPPIATMQMPLTEASIPRRVQDDEFAAYIMSSSRASRKILALVDGQRSIREIAILSHTSSQHIMRLLLSVSTKKMIEL